jgi:hypothetical protein
MTTYTELQEQHREIKPDINGAVLLGYEATSDKIQVLNVDFEGKLLVNSGSVSVYETQRYYANKEIVSGNYEDVFTKTAEANKKYKIEKVLFCGNGNGIMRLFFDGLPIISLHNSYFSPSVSFDCDILLEAGQIMTAKVLNSSIAGETNYYELFIFYKEVSV